MAKWSDLNQWEWRKLDGVVQKRVKVEIYSGWSDFTIQDLQEAIETHRLTDDVDFDMTTESGYYDESDRAVLNLRGWRDATDEEIREAYKQVDDANLALAKSAKERAEHAAAELARLRKSNPELFPE